MNPRSRLLVTTLIAAFLAVSFGCRTETDNDDSVILRREWLPNAEFAGDVWAARIARERGFQLQVKPGGELIDPIKEVRAGAAHFGVASADRVLRENEAGAGLVIVAAATYRSPVVFLTKPESGIMTAQGFVEHTIGIQAGTNTELVFDALLKVIGLTRKQMHVVESGWGTANFESNALDVLAAFDYDEPVQLAMKNVRINPPIEPRDYGVDLIGTVYFTRKQLIDKKPKLVQKFVSALVDGWHHALRNRPEAIAMVKTQFKDINEKKELRSLERGAVYFAGEGGHPLYASAARYQKMVATLIDLGKIRRESAQSVSFEQCVDYRFLQNATLEESVRR